MQPAFPHPGSDAGLPWAQVFALVVPATKGMTGQVKLGTLEPAKVGGRAGEPAFWRRRLCAGHRLVQATGLHVAAMLPLGPRAASLHVAAMLPLATGLHPAAPYCRLPAPPPTHTGQHQVRGRPHRRDPAGRQAARLQAHHGGDAALPPGKQARQGAAGMHCCQHRGGPRMVPSLGRQCGASWGRGKGGADSDACLAALC